MSHQPYPDTSRTLRQLDRSRDAFRQARLRPTPPAEPAPVKASMDRRSWYMPKQVADDLAGAVETLHYDTRQPKHAVLAELVAVALLHLPDIQQRLRPAP
jgi:hypothetical protein